MIFFKTFKFIARLLIFIRNVGKCAKKQSVVIIVSPRVEKECSRVKKIFVQVTLVEKGHRGNILRPRLRLVLKNLSLDALFQPR